jgi:hypothetical protein
MNPARIKLFTLVISVSSLVLTFTSKVGFRAPGPGNGSSFVFVGEFQAYILSFKAPIKRDDQLILIAAERPGNRNLRKGRARNRLGFGIDDLSIRFLHPKNDKAHLKEKRQNPANGRAWAIDKRGRCDIGCDEFDLPRKNQ